ncbi:MAG: hypothetical protein AAFU64_01405 [Bacteroidota bacterium]
MMATGLVVFAEYWLWAGAAVSLVFLTIGIDRIDEDARGAYVFRPLLVPAILLIWPLVLWRWFALETGRVDEMKRYATVRAAHGVAAFGMAIAIGAFIVVGFSVKQSWPDHIAPERLSEAEQ